MCSTGSRDLPKTLGKAVNSVVKPRRVAFLGKGLQPTCRSPFAEIEQQSVLTSLTIIDRGKDFAYSCLSPTGV